MRLTLRLLAVSALLVGGIASAEPVGSHWEVTPLGGFTLFDGRMRFPGGLPLRDTGHLGVRLGWRSTSWVGLEGAGGLTSTSEDVQNGRDFSWRHASASL